VRNLVCVLSFNSPNILLSFGGPRCTQFEVLEIAAENLKLSFFAPMHAYHVCLIIHLTALHIVIVKKVN
jgi:hypothetical protein